MFTILKFSFGVVTTTLKYTLSAGIFIGGVGIITKPDPLTFKPFAENFVKHKIESSPTQQNGLAGIFETLVKKTFSTGINLAASTRVEDYIFFNRGIYKIGNDELNFIGMFNNWYNV